MSNKRRFRRQLDEERDEIAHDREFAEWDRPNWPREGGRTFGTYWRGIFPHSSRYGEGARPIRNGPAIFVVRALVLALLVTVVVVVVYYFVTT